MSRSPIRYSPSTGGFYRTDIHSEAMPDDVVSVGVMRHAELLAAQGSRRIIAGPDGKPALKPVHKVRRADVLARMIAAVKREAARRILAIASLERQANDNAALALAALDGNASAAAEAACARRASIDAVRAASNAIETAIGGWSLAALTSFEPAADARWPQEA